MGEIEFVFLPAVPSGLIGLRRTAVVAAYPLEHNERQTVVRTDGGGGAHLIDLPLAECLARVGSIPAGAMEPGASAETPAESPAEPQGCEEPFRPERGQAARVYNLAVKVRRLATEVMGEALKALNSASEAEKPLTAKGFADAVALLAQRVAA